MICGLAFFGRDSLSMFGLLAAGACWWSAQALTRSRLGLYAAASVMLGPCASSQLSAACFGAHQIELTQCGVPSTVVVSPIATSRQHHNIRLLTATPVTYTFASSNNNKASNTVLLINKFPPPSGLLSMHSQQQSATLTWRLLGPSKIPSKRTTTPTFTSADKSSWSQPFIRPSPSSQSANPSLTP